MYNDLHGSNEATYHGQVVNLKKVNKMSELNDYEMLDLRKKLCNMFFNKTLRFKTSFEQHDYTEEEIRQSCDDSVSDFMIENFGSEWSNNEQAQFFYEVTACDLRINTENDAIEIYHAMND